MPRALGVFRNQRRLQTVNSDLCLGRPGDVVVAGLGVCHCFLVEFSICAPFPEGDTGREHCCRSTQAGLLHDPHWSHVIPGILGGCAGLVRGSQHLHGEQTHKARACAQGWFSAAPLPWSPAGPSTSSSAEIHVWWCPAPSWDPSPQVLAPGSCPPVPRLLLLGTPPCSPCLNFHLFIPPTASYLFPMSPELWPGAHWGTTGEPWSLPRGPETTQHRARMFTHLLPTAQAKTARVLTEGSSHEQYLLIVHQSCDVWGGRCFVGQLQALPPHGALTPSSTIQ